MLGSVCFSLGVNSNTDSSTDPQRTCFLDEFATVVRGAKARTFWYWLVNSMYMLEDLVNLEADSMNVLSYSLSMQIAGIGFCSFRR